MTLVPAHEPAPGTATTEPAPSPARDLIAAVIREFPFDDYGLDDVSYGLEAEPDTQEWVPALADRVLAVILPGTRALAGLARSDNDAVNRVMDLYERWVKAGPPPLGTSISREWDRRLVELRDAILPHEMGG
ncbi:hypothetical protein WB388_08860 [Streptomyces brasiliscabiei]|uniref:CdiI immunity protein domain-containing protein n=1 Tax=Streptomyces brasiliscabiei TaxID=2736302 RepID=A0ABU8GA84_9ACTN